jgi:hypothetical protein
MRTGSAILGAAFILIAVAGCDFSNVREAAFSAPPGDTLVAKTGDTVMDVRVMRPPLSALWPADRVASPQEIGRVVVRFTGVQSGRAVFIRNDLVMTDKDTPPLWVPVGVSSPVSAYAAAAQPITLVLAPGEYMPLEGRRLVVRRVDPTTLDYSVTSE